MLTVQDAEDDTVILVARGCADPAGSYTGDNMCTDNDDVSELVFNAFQIGHAEELVEGHTCTCSGDKCNHHDIDGITEQSGR